MQTVEVVLGEAQLVRRILKTNNGASRAAQRLQVLSGPAAEIKAYAVSRP